MPDGWKVGQDSGSEGMWSVSKAGLLCPSICKSVVERQRAFTTHMEEADTPIATSNTHNPYLRVGMPHHSNDTASSIASPPFTCCRVLMIRVFLPHHRNDSLW